MDFDNKAPFYKTPFPKQNLFATLFSRPKNPGEVQRDYASNQSIKIQTNKAKWKPKPTPKNPGEVQRNYASKQSMKIQTNKAKWNKGFIYEKGSPHKI